MFFLGWELDVAARNDDASCDTLPPINVAARNNHSSCDSHPRNSAHRHILETVLWSTSQTGTKNYSRVSGGSRIPKQKSPNITFKTCNVSDHLVFNSLNSSSFLTVPNSTITIKEVLTQSSTFSLRPHRVFIEFKVGMSIGSMVIPPYSYQFWLLPTALPLPIVTVTPSSALFHTKIEHQARNYIK